MEEPKIGDNMTDIEIKQVEKLQYAEKKENPKSSPFKPIKRFFQNITIEPIAILLITPRFICSLALENLSLEKACLVNLKLNKTICDAMVLRDRSGYAPEDEEAVQYVVSGLLPYRSAFNIVQVIMILMIGSWSDKTMNKRPMFIVPYIGDIVSILGYILCVYFFMELSVEYPILIESVFSISFGGVPLLMAGMYSFIASITDIKARTVRVGAVSLVFRTSLTIGIVLSGFMLKYLGFYGVYLISLGLNIAGFVYIFAVVKKKKPSKLKDEKANENQCCRFLWNGIRDSVASSFEVCFKARPNRKRTTMILLQLANIMAFGIMVAEGSVLYLFCRKQFGWDEVDYSIFKFYKTIVEISGCAFVLAFLSKYLGWNDAHIAILAVFSRVIGTSIMAFAPNGLFFYIGTFADIFNGAIIIAVRSLITKTVNQNEQGIANSLTGLLDSFGSFAMGSVYGYVYYKTLAVFPGTFFLLSLLMYLLIFLIFLIINKIAFGKNQESEEAEEL